MNLMQRQLNIKNLTHGKWGLAGVALFLMGVVVLLNNSPVQAGSAHDHGPSGEPVVRSSTVEITDTTAKNIGLKVDSVEQRQIFDSVESWGRLAVQPTKLQIVSSRIKGQILKVNVEKGQSVKPGDPLAVVESLQMGNPPPRATYRAPTDGIVTDINVSPGEGIRANQQILSVASPEDFRIRTRVHERNLEQIGQSTKATVTQGPRADTSWSASVNHIDVHVDPASGYGTVWLKPDNPNDITPFFGKRTSVDLLIGSPEPHPTVPRSALLGTSGNYFVFIQASDNSRTFSKRTVVLGPRNGHHVAIKDGIQSGDMVVVEGNYQLQYASPAENDGEDGHTEHADEGHGHAHGASEDSHDQGDESASSDHSHAHEEPMESNQKDHADDTRDHSTEHGHDHGDSKEHKSHDNEESDGHGHDHEGGTDH